MEKRNAPTCVAASPPLVALRAGTAPPRRRPSRVGRPGGAQPEGRCHAHLHRRWPPSRRCCAQPEGPVAGSAAALLISSVSGEHRRHVDLPPQGRAPSRGGVLAGGWSSSQCTAVTRLGTGRRDPWLTGGGELGGRQSAASSVGGQRRAGWVAGVELGGWPASSWVGGRQ
jgi:hypothetical protein